MVPVASLKGKMALALEHGRARYNARFFEARRQWPRLDGDVFLTHLRTVVAPIVEPCEAAGVVTQALYDISLHLVGGDLASLVAPLWLNLLPGLARFLDREPHRVVAALSNAVIHMVRTPGVRVGEWLETMAQVGPHCADVDTLLTVGQVAAWRAGMAHFRDGALAAAARLPPDLACAALRMAGIDMLVELVADPWRHPHGGRGSRELQIVGRTGGFRGFGGLFVRPPLVQSHAGLLYATDGEDSWIVCADAFGMTLHRAPLPVSEDRKGAFVLANDGEVMGAGTTKTMPRLANPTSWAATASTLAVVVPFSHWIYLVAARSA